MSSAARVPGLATIALLAACGAHDAAAGDSPTVQASSSVGHVDSGATHPTATTLNAADATTAQPGRDYALVRTASKAGTQSVQRYDLAFDDAGRALTISGPPSTETSHPTHTLLLRDRHGRKVARLARVGTQSRPAQVTAAVLTKNFAVWKVSTSFDLESDNWVIYSQDLRTYNTTLLARATPTTAATTPAAPGGTRPSIAGNRVYFSAATTPVNSGDQPFVGVFSVPLTGGPKRLEAHGTGSIATGHSLIWETDLGKAFTVKRRDLRTGHTTTVFSSHKADCQKISGLAANSRHNLLAILATCQHTSRLFISSSTRHLILDSARPLGYLSVGTNFTWIAQQTSSGYRQLLVPTHGATRVLRIGRGGVFGAATVGGPYFGWSQSTTRGHTAYVATLK